MAANGDYPADEDPADGYPPVFSDPPESPNADPSTFETITTNGETIRLVPIDVAVAWYERGEARFADARGLYQYEYSHVYGSVLSPAQKKSDGGAIPDWPREDRVVTYCGCPHHLSSLRAAGLQKAGYEEVYAIDEGFGVWSERGYPMAGNTFATGTESSISEWTIEGTVDSQYAGEYAWASADRQYEAAPIDADGGFSLHLKFADVSSETDVQVSTPAFSVTKPLGELASGVVEG
jgi:rhodanese-related sulfurtransferase